MALSVRGGGFDTPRYWEIVACKTLLISEQPNIQIPNNFEHKKHALFCRADLGDLVDLVTTYASDDAARERVVEAAYGHLLKYHTCERRAEYVLDTCRRTL
jgi:spore maturation protein CgeB